MGGVWAISALCTPPPTELHVRSCKDGPRRILCFTQQNTPLIWSHLRLIALETVLMRGDIPPPFPQAVGQVLAEWKTRCKQDPV